MSNEKTAWYDRQALISKFLTYGAILILVVTLASAVILAFLYQQFLHELPTMLSIASLAIGGIFIAGIFIAFSAIIDLLIVHAEALRSR